MSEPEARGALTMEELLAKVEVAEGSNFQLECDLCTALEPERLEWARNQKFQLKPPNYTYSLDAALALVEAKLPGWRWNIGQKNNGFGGVEYEADIFGPLYGSRDMDPATFAVRLGLTPALALIAALLKALIAQQPKE